MKSCPYCSEQIQDTATKCRYCGEWIDARPESQASPIWTAGGGAGVPTGPGSERRERPGAAGVEWIYIVCGLLMALGSFLPWVHETSSLFTIDRNGFQLGAAEGFSIDGLIVLLFGMGAGLVGATRLTRTAFPPLIQRSPIVLGVIAFLVAISNISDRVSAFGVSSSTGYGLWMAIVGSAGVSVFGIVDWWAARKQRRTAKINRPVAQAVQSKLRECPACGESVSSIAKACPRCFRPLPQQPESDTLAGTVQPTSAS